MKHIFLLIGFLTAQNLSAQFVLNLGKNVYYKATVELEDGTMKNGYVLNFDDKKAYYFDISQYEQLFASPEHNNNLTKEYYTFRENEKAKDEKIKMTDIKKITLEEPNSITGEIEIKGYEKRKIAKPTKDLEIDLWEKEVLLPVMYKNSKLTIYQDTEIKCMNKSVSSCYASGYNYYFLPKGAEYAVKPFEITPTTIFSIKTIGPKIYAGLEYMGKDCPLYLEHLASRKSNYSENYSSFASDEYTKAYKAGMDEYKADLKKAKKSMSKEDFKKYEIDKKFEQLQQQNEQFYNAMFNEEVMDYINSCE